MCGIFGFYGTDKEQQAAAVVLEGLQNLSYRGYDSWGITVVSEGTLHTTKDVGHVATNVPASLPKASIAIAHSRWATHGGVTKVNAHPHTATDGSFVLAQNGIIENFEVLKSDLQQKGYTFLSQTDTEVIVYLVEEQKKKGLPLDEAVRQAFLLLDGRNTILVLSTEGEIIAARNGSPLVVGKGKNKDEWYFSSDTLSFANTVEKVLVVENGQMVVCSSGKVELLAISTGKTVEPEFEKFHFASQKADKAGFDHFMQKEIDETPQVIAQVLAQDKTMLLALAEAVTSARQVYTLGSGTAGIASQQIAFYLRKIAKVNTISLVGAEAQSYFELFNKDDLIIAPSQSGETADVLEVLEVAQKKGVKIATYVNMYGSIMTRMADFPFMAGAGPEMCVMSTKVFTSQIAWGYLLAKTIAGEFEQGRAQLQELKEQLRICLDDSAFHAQLKNVAGTLVDAQDIFLLGKSQNMAMVLEGMVKIIEGSYKHAHGIPAGDLKHYAITIMEKGVPVFVLVSNDEARTDSISAGTEVKTRGATVIGIGQGKVPSFDSFIELPDVGEVSAIMNIVPLQLIAYYLTVALGNNVDKPRNIAKSVTVK